MNKLFRFLYPKPVEKTVHLGYIKDKKAIEALSSEGVIQEESTTSPDYISEPGQNNELSQAATSKSSHPGFNPFVKQGDKVRLHSISGVFIVHSVHENGFVIHAEKVEKSGKKFINCNWEDFRNWSSR